MARLLEKYKKAVVPELMTRFGWKNPLAVPRLEKIMISMGVGKNIENKNRMGAAVKDLATLSGQQPLICLARKSVSGFKLRKGEQIGCKVTLRGRRMYEFLDRLVSIVIPRIRDFRGLPRSAFDGRGNYSLGISEQVVFPEIEIDKIEFVQGLNVTICVRRASDEEAYELLRLLGMPFSREEPAKARAVAKGA